MSDAGSIQTEFEVLEQTCPNVLECSNFLHQSGRAFYGNTQHLQVGLDHRVPLRRRSLDFETFPLMNVVGLCQEFVFFCVELGLNLGNGYCSRRYPRAGRHVFLAVYCDVKGNFRRYDFSWH